MKRAVFCGTSRWNPNSTMLSFLWGLLVLLLLGCLTPKAANGQGSKHTKTRVEVVFLLKKGADLTPLQLRGLKSVREFTLYEKIEKNWKEWGGSPNNNGPTYVTEGGLRVTYHLEPGHYRIRTIATPRHPWQAEKVFEVQAGEAKTVQYVHERKKMVEVSMRLINDAEDTPIKNFDFYCLRKIGVENEHGFITGHQGLTTDGKGRVEFFIWEDTKSLSFEHSIRRFTDEKVTFSKKELVEGAAWKLSREYPNLRIKILFRTPDGDRPYSAELWEKYFPEGTYVYLPLGAPDGSGRYYVPGQIHIHGGLFYGSRSEMTYWDLEPGKVRMIGCLIEIDHTHYRVLKGCGKKVVGKRAAKKLSATVVIDTEPVKYYTLTVKPARKKDPGFSRELSFGAEGFYAPFRGGAEKQKLKLTEGIHTVTVKHPDYEAFHGKIQMDRDRVIRLKRKEKERQEKKKYSLYADYKRPLGPEFEDYVNFEVYSPKVSKPVGGGTVWDSKQKIGLLPPGRYLVLLKATRKDIKGEKPDHTIFVSREIRIKNSDKTVNMEVEEANWTEFVVQMPGKKAAATRPAAMLWGVWEGAVVRLGTGKTSKELKLKFSIPFDGQYWLEVLTPSKKDYKEEAKRYRKGKAYYTERIAVKRGQTVTAQVLASTFHEPTGQMPELSDLPGSANAGEESPVENETPTGGGDAQRSGSRPLGRKWLLRGGIVLGVLVVIALGVAAVKRKKNGGDQA